MLASWYHSVLILSHSEQYICHTLFIPAVGVSSLASKPRCYLRCARLGVVSSLLGRGEAWLSFKKLLKAFEHIAGRVVVGYWKCQTWLILPVVHFQFTLCTSSLCVIFQQSRSIDISGSRRFFGILTTELYRGRCLTRSPYLSLFTIICIRKTSAFALLAAFRHDVECH